MRPQNHTLNTAIDINLKHLDLLRNDMKFAKAPIFQTS